MLNVYLNKYVRAFIFQIVNQSSSLNDFLASVGGTLVTSNGWKITTGIAPEVNILDKTIWLRGNDSEQNLRVHRCWNLSSDSARDQFVAEIDSTLKELVALSSNRGRAPYGTSTVTLPLGKTKTSKNIVRA
jgi:hypothetical protein